MNKISNDRAVRGATLLEIMVSVFIMAFGIMALMLAQIRSVSSVREAEMQTRVAQSVQNLSEGMLVNADARTKRDEKIQFSQYNVSNTSIQTDCNPTQLATVCGAASGLTDSKALADCHKQIFAAELACALPNAKSITYQITEDSAANQTTIRVNWTESTGSGSDADEFDFTYSAVVGGQ